MIYLDAHLNLHIIISFLGDPEVSCGFDGTLCSFKQDFDDETDWISGRGSTPTPLTGPNTDHTTQSGKNKYRNNTFLFLMYL